MPSKLLLEIDGTTVEGGDLDALVELRAEEATHEADALTVVARVEPDAAGEWPSLLDALVTPRTPVVAQISRGDAGYRFDGYSAEAVWELDAEGSSTLTVKAIDRSLDLDAEEKITAWPGQRESSIAQVIFESNGLDADVEKTPDAPDPDVHVLLQRDTDWAFVRALASRWGYVAYLEAEPDLSGSGLLGAIGGALGGLFGGGPAPGTVTGHFHPLDPLAEPQGELALGHGGDAYRVQVRAELLRGAEVVATRIPPLAAKPNSARATGDDEAQGSDSLAAQVTNLLAPGDAPGEVDPQAVATGLARRSAFAVTLTVQLDTERAGLLLRARRPVLVRGLGSSLSGRYLVDRVRHVVTLDSHVQDVTLTRNALKVTGDEPFAAGGLELPGGLG
jgi:hypothetical protein